MARMKLSNSTKDKSRKRTEGDRALHGLIWGVGLGIVVFVSLLFFLVRFGIIEDNSRDFVEDNGYTAVSYVSQERINKIPGDLRFEVDEFLQDKKTESMELATAHNVNNEAVLIGVDEEAEEIYEIAHIDDVASSYLDMEKE